MASATTQPFVSLGLKNIMMALLAIVIGLMIGAWFAFQKNTKSSFVSASSPTVQFTAIEAFPQLSFESPVELTHANDNSGRLFVLEQAGVIKVFKKKAQVNKAGIFLDINKTVKSGGEMGLLGLAFHPEYKKNGYFYVNYTVANPLRTVVSRFSVSKNNPDQADDQADPGSEQVLLTIRQPYSNHNGGKLAFGPDGYLYISIGDGGSAGDPQNNGQNKASLLGKILRIDVNKQSGGLPYGIPADNPFVSESTSRPEIYAYGLRNPWRFSFDKKTGQLWTGDVGQNDLEEINIIEKGGNYGWRIKEARKCYNPKTNCVEKGLIEPVFQYNHTNGDISITGGLIYRGKQLADLQGKYIYADYASGRVWALTYDSPQHVTNKVLINRAGSLSAFGEDEDQEIYICDHSGGKILSLAQVRKQ